MIGAVMCRTFPDFSLDLPDCFVLNQHKLIYKNKQRRYDP